MLTDLAESSEVANQVGRARVNEMLRPDSLSRKPRLMIHSTCTKTIHQMNRFVWDDYRQNLEKGQKQKPKEKNDDFPGILRYFANSEPLFKNLRDGGRIIRRSSMRPNRGDRVRVRAPSYARGN